MADRTYESASDYIIKSVKLVKNGISAEIRNAVVQLELFENIAYPYLTGQIYFKDDARIFDSVSFDGVETCEIILTQPTKQPRDITKTFAVRSVSSTQKINDLSEAVSLHLIEKIGYDGSIDRFCKSYTGTPLEIVNRIAREKLSIVIDQPKVVPAQKTMKVVIPYLTPFEAISFVMERMSTADGLPYYFFSTINDNNLQLKSLEECLNAPVWNPGRPYRYSKAYTQSEVNLDTKSNPYIVQSYFAPTDGEDTLDLVLGGAIGGQFNVVDLTTGRNESKKFNITKVFSKLENKGIIPRGFTNVIETKYDNFKLDTLKSVNVHRSVMVNTYNTTNNYYQEDSLDRYELDMISKAIKQIMFKSYISLKVPGSPFLIGSNNSIGKQFEYFHMNNNVQASEKPSASEDDVKDKKRSGNYMTFSARHVFYNTRHTTELSAIRLGKEV